MKEEDYRDMVIDHDKHLDSLTQSVNVLADNVKNTNNKLDNMIDIIQTQNILTDRLSNLSHNFKDSFEKVHAAIDEIEDIQRTFISSTIVKWFAAILIAYTVSFGTYVVSEIHRLDIEMHKQHTID